MIRDGIRIIFDEHDMDGFATWLTEPVRINRILSLLQEMDDANLPYMDRKIVLPQGKLYGVNLVMG